MSRRRKNSNSGKENDIYDIIAYSIIYGLISLAFLGGVVILWWGEDQTSRYYRFLDFAQNKYNTITNISNVYQSNDGELVYLTGPAHAETKLEDPLFNIKVEGFKLSRKVRYYQLVEYKTKKKDKDSTGSTYSSHYEYSYRKQWTSSPKSSYKFYNHNYRNKAKAPIVILKELNLVSRDATIGAYSIPEWLIESIKDSQPIKPNLSMEQKSDLCKKLNISCNLLKQTDSGFYIGDDPESPELGDVSITLTYTPVSEVSILAQQKGNSFERYNSNKSLSSDDPDNVNLGEIMTGTVEPEKIFSETSDNVTGGSFVTRIVSAILIIISAYLMPWDWFLKHPFARLLINGSKSKKEWSLKTPLRIGASVMLFIACVGWYFVFPVAGTILLLLSLLLLFYPYLKNLVTHTDKTSKARGTDEFMHLDESDKK